MYISSALTYKGMSIKVEASSLIYKGNNKSYLDVLIS
jgi:hypothetical protein